MARLLTVYRRLAILVLAVALTPVLLSLPAQAGRGDLSELLSGGGGFLLFLLALGALLCCCGGGGGQPRRRKRIVGWIEE